MGQYTYYQILPPTNLLQSRSRCSHKSDASTANDGPIENEGEMCETDANGDYSAPIK